MNDEQLHGHLLNQQGSRHSLNTPALVIDLDALARNIARMADFARTRGLQLRPHAKTHKSPDIAKRQIEAGAVGICCAKIGEAEVLADHGVARGLHITSPVVAVPRDRAHGGAERADGRTHVRGRQSRQRSRPRRGGSGVRESRFRSSSTSTPACIAQASARRRPLSRCSRPIQAEAALRYAGVQFYCGAQQHIESYEARRQALAERAAFAPRRRRRAERGRRPAADRHRRRNRQPPHRRDARPLHRAAGRLLRLHGRSIPRLRLDRRRRTRRRSRPP